MKKIITSAINLALFMPVFFISTATQAQTEPKIQEVSVRAPDNIKIDGNLNEWDNKFQAKNMTDRIRYTVSNDDNKLYLTIHALGAYGNAKLASGGVTFTVSHSVEKRKREKATDNISITYPLVDAKTASSITSKQYFYWNNLFKDIPGNKKSIDSLYDAINAQADGAYKEIRVLGIKDVDTLISVYNTDGIRAVARFDKTIYFSYELAIPLKYLGLSTTGDPVKFSYNIKLNGVQLPTIKQPANRPGLNNPDMITPRVIFLGPNGGPNPDMEYVYEPTDFWAEYTLAKK